MDTRNSSHDTAATGGHPPELLSKKLMQMIDALPAGGVSLNQLLVIAGDDGLMLLTILLSLVFLIPVSIPGVSTVFGAAILMIGLCSLAGRNLWLPEKLRNKVLSTEKLRPALHQAIRWMSYLERISEPHRLPWLAHGAMARTLNRMAIVLAALLLMAPFGFVPFSNTFPAVALICFAIGFVQRDGVCILLGHVANVATIVYFGVLLTGGGLAIREAFRYFSG